jgi:hypothetical protein
MKNTIEYFVIRSIFNAAHTIKKRKNEYSIEVKYSSEDLSLLKKYYKGNIFKELDVDFIFDMKLIMIYLDMKNALIYKKGKVTIQEW